MGVHGLADANQGANRLKEATDNRTDLELAKILLTPNPGDEHGHLSPVILISLSKLLAKRSLLMPRADIKIGCG